MANYCQLVTFYLTTCHSNPVLFHVVFTQPTSIARLGRTFYACDSLNDQIKTTTSYKYSIVNCMISRLLCYSQGLFIQLIILNSLSGFQCLPLQKYNTVNRIFIYMFVGCLLFDIVDPTCDNLSEQPGVSQDINN